MLPILRVIPVGGVFLAIAILLLALNPSGDQRARLARGLLPATGALLALEFHPEWRQFLMQAAVRRADEINRLRQLPDTPVVVPKPPAAAKAVKPPSVAAVPNKRDDSDPQDVTGTVQAPDAAIPVDIGESSSTELPVLPQKDAPPVVGPAAGTSDNGVVAPAPDKTEIAQPAARHPATETTAKPAAIAPVRQATTTPPAVTSAGEKPAGEIKTAIERAKPQARKRRVRRIKAASKTAAQPDFFQALFGPTNGGEPTPDPHY
ncbi:MAG TPA: hypothetical protein VFA57_05020 [Pseudolabrys sp.]|nr:hypothetical protein [Pseudolabrys sp.]